MSEFFSDAEEQIFGNLTSEFEAAMEDQRLRNAVEQARLKEAVIIALPVEQQEDAAREAIVELDTMIRHLFSSKVYVDGRIQVASPEQNEMIEHSVNNVWAQFQGFTAHRAEGGRIHFRYSFNTICHSDESPATEDEVVQLIKQSGNNYPMLQLPSVAEFNDVSLNFDVISPERAYAWLSLTQPEALHDIDDRIAAVRRDEDALINIGRFRLAIPKDASEQQSRMLRHSVSEYVGAMIIVDTEVPYEATLDGLAWNEEEERYLYYSDERVLLSVEGMNLFHTGNYEEGDDENDRYGFAINGFIAPSDTLDDRIPVTVPLATVQSLDSLRRRIYGDNQ